MSETRFTRGPWTIGKLVACQDEGSNCWHTFSYQRDIFPPLGEAGPVAIVSHEDPADANLISAAPELYAALEKIFQCVDSGVLVRNIEGDARPDWALRALDLVATLKECETALAKARGEEPKP